MTEYEDWIKQLRLRSGWTQRKLSEKSGITMPTIINVENHLRGPSLFTFTALLNTMGYGLKVCRLEDETNDVDVHNA